MFTGLIQALGHVARRDGSRLEVSYVAPSASAAALGPISLGDSIAVSGVCLTVVEFVPGSVSFDVSAETWARTNLGQLGALDLVNLESSLTPSSKLGGHFVTGHVDAVASVVEVIDDLSAQRWRFSLPVALKAMVAEKGAIAVDGVSLTVNAVGDDFFDVTLIPHTLAHTRFGRIGIAAKVNLEVDLMARYALRALEVIGATR